MQNIIYTFQDNRRSFYIVRWGTTLSNPVMYYAWLLHIDVYVEFSKELLN